MGLITKLQQSAEKNKARIGIGFGGSKEESKIINKSTANATKLGYVKKVLEFENSKDLVLALKNGEINSAVRGNLPAKEAISNLKNSFKTNLLFRAALMCVECKHCFFLAPVGIDEGIFIDERFEFIKLIDSLLQHFGITSNTAIISGGRLPEDLGRSGLVDESLKAGEKLFNLANEGGFKVKHYGILIEQAYKMSNIIIAPNGIIGNLLFRTLHLVSNCRSFGAPLLNLDVPFIDTSRSKKDYTDSIMLASALSVL